MAVKKTLTSAKPCSEGGKVTRWSLTMKYEQGTEGEADYYTVRETSLLLPQRLMMELLLTNLLRKQKKIGLKKN